jgi:CubicO group peptidase (beta-lactamase class C family)
MRNPNQPTRRLLVQAMGLGLAGLTGLPAAAAGPAGNPGVRWRRSAPEAAGFRSAGLMEMERSLYGSPTTALMVVRGGEIAYSYGDIAQVSYLASARKSVLSILYGKYVADGRIDLNRTLGELGVGEPGAPLLPIERSATIRDLLMSSSGVYLPQGSPGGSGASPPRGSQKPGSHFFYNNWDFNVAGAIFEQLSGKPVLRALAEDLARPLQFEDFDPSRQRMLGYRTGPSRYLAYHMFLSGRDMARLGLLMVNRGRWGGRQIIPAGWVAESTALHVSPGAVGDPDGLGYGYLWWKPQERRGEAWKGSFMADGNYGQFILCLPAIDTVIVHRRALPDAFAVARNLGDTTVNPPGVSAERFLEIAEKILAARVA